MTDIAHVAAASHGATVTRPRAGDDEEAAARRLWEELERMPTPQRARSAVVTLEEVEGGGGANNGGACRKAVVDVGRLGAGQRRALVGRLVGSVDRDNERFLRELRERIDRYVTYTPAH